MKAAYQSFVKSRVTMSDTGTKLVKIRIHVPIFTKVRYWKVGLVSPVIPKYE